MSLPSVNLRNLERIHESGSGKSPKLATIALAAAGISAIVVSGTLLERKGDAAAAPPIDPLGALVAASKQPAAEKVGVEVEEVSFPSVLSDTDKPTTALVAVRGSEAKAARPGEEAAEASVGAEAVPPLDAQGVDLAGLTKTPLPAGSLLARTNVTATPKDELGRLSVRLSDVDADVTPSPGGSEGGFMIQVGSFKNQDDADRFVEELKARGHAAFRQAAHVPGRGVWHRVRIGSFKTGYEATLYKDKLERKERLTALVIDPDKVQRQEQIRAAKLAERIRQHEGE